LLLPLETRVQHQSESKTFLERIQLGGGLQIMWIVRLALRRPYTFVVLAILILVMGLVSIFRTPTDIFPNINIPVVSIIWNFSGLVPEDMNNRIVYVTERALTTTVDNIEHIESQSLYGVAVVKVFLQPNANVERGIAQITAVSQTQLRQLPTGTTPPLVLAYSASSVPVLQLALSGQGLSEQQLNDFGLNFIRTQLITVPGASVPYPYGGKQRQVEVDLNPSALQAKGLSALDVVNAIAMQNLILPTGTSKIGGTEYQVTVPNAAPETMQDLNRIPLKTIGGTTIYMKDVAWVHDGSPPQTNIVRVNGQRSVLMIIQKSGSASTLNVISGIKALLPQIANTLPPQLKMQPLADQSIFVKGAISGVVREALIAACLTALMILVFLGSWRSTLIIATSIPLAILCSIIALSAIGETINIMTLGGLALAVGILVDDATVEVENINRNRAAEPDKSMDDVVLESASQIATPAFVSTLSICIVFAPMFLLSGVARYLFLPLAEAVVFAMLASYLLSRTIVPTMAKYLLVNQEVGAEQKPSRNPLVRFQRRFEAAFERFREGYHRLLERVLHHRRLFLAAFFAACLASLAVLIPWLGQDFFPSVDAGSFKLHVRGPTGMRIEDTAFLCDLIENSIRKQIPAAEVSSITDNIGLPYSGINLSYSNSAPVGTSDADVLVTLAPKHHPTADYVNQLRVSLAKQFPGVSFAYLPSDIVTQILNFGLPAPIDIQVLGRDLAGNHAWANQVLQQAKSVPGTADLRIQQPFNEPYLSLRIERTKAQELGFSARDIAQNLLVSLSGSFQTAPTFWVDPKTGVSYNIESQTPQYRSDSLQDLVNIPVTGTNPAIPQSLMASLISMKRSAGMAVVSHYNIQPVIDIFGSNSGRDLGGVSRDINKIIDANRSHLPRGSQVIVRGQVQTMRSSYIGLLVGLVFAILLDYLLIVVNFQSWLDPFIMISALPAALAGIAWMLFITHTTLSVPALMGTIMCMGVATANSILVVSFAREQIEQGKDAISAALEAGFTRFRPVLMTALAMIIGMVPMALGMGDGGEQNAPLGRAVIGGLLFATVSTLLFVPTFFSVLEGKRQTTNNDGTTSGEVA
jgi:multidrug efflux pump subunit AcrB